MRNCASEVRIFDAPGMTILKSPYDKNRSIFSSRAILLP
jgi:hypothetical protein